MSSVTSQIASAMLADYTRKLIDVGFPVADVLEALKAGVDMIERIERDVPGGIDAAIAKAKELQDDEPELSREELTQKIDEFFGGLGFIVKTGTVQCDCPRCRARRERAAHQQRAAEGARHQGEEPMDL